MKRYRKGRRQHYTDLERIRYHRIQDEAGCHRHITSFYGGFRFVESLSNAEVVNI